MNHKIFFTPVIIAFTALFILSVTCRSDKLKESKSLKDNKLSVKEKVTGVCIWDGIAIREKPSRNSELISTLNLGESFYYLNVNAEDSSYRNRKYLKIELSDGTVAWAAEFGLIIDAKTGVVKEKVPVYKRPDLLTISDREFSPMDIVAITEENDDWIKVTGEKKKLKGWIKKSFVSFNEEDIAFSLIAKRELADSDDKPLLDKIQNILNNNPYPTSIFVETLNEIAREEKNKKRLEEIMLEEEGI
jgi:predicted small secreted protein